MTRMEFMTELEELLADLTEDERAEALQYYNNYFDDAGPFSEFTVIEELGSPGKVADIIRTGLDEAAEESAEFTENGFTDTRFAEDSLYPETKEGSIEGGEHADAEKEPAGADERTASGSQTGERQADPFNREDTFGHQDSFGGEGHYGGQRFEEERKRDWYENRRGRERRYREPSMRERSAGKTVLFVILAVCALPIILPLAGAAFAVLVSLGAAAFALIFSGALAAVGLLIGGCVCVGVGFVYAFTHVGAGIIVLGGGMICLALAIFIGIFSLWVYSKLFPWIGRMMSALAGRIFRRGGQSA